MDVAIPGGLAKRRLMQHDENGNTLKDDREACDDPLSLPALPDGNGTGGRCSRRGHRVRPLQQFLSAGRSRDARVSGLRPRIVAARGGVPALRPPAGRGGARSFGALGPQLGRALEVARCGEVVEPAVNPQRHASEAGGRSERRRLRRGVY